MKKIIPLFVLLFISTILISQEVEIPNNLSLKKAEDFKKAEPLVLQSIDWLSQTPVSENTTKRKEVNGFLMQWISGSPSVTIELISGIVPLDCPECLMSFMTGWTKYSLENNYSKNKLECVLAGVENAIGFYTSNKSEIGKNSDMEKLIKMKTKGKLKKFVESKF